MHAGTLCASIHLEIVSDEAVFESSRSRILDGEVPTTEDLIAHIRAVTLSEHPGVLVANYRSTREVYRRGGLIQVKCLLKLSFICRCIQWCLKKLVNSQFMPHLFVF